MKIALTYTLIYFACSLFGQELSLAIPITPGQLSDGGFQIEQLEDGYLVMGQSGCIDSNIYITCLGLLRLDESGDATWSRTFDGSPYGSLAPNGRTMVIHNDTIYVANMIWKTDHNEIRMMSFDMDGNLLKEVDFFIPYENTFFLRGMIGTGEKLVAFSEVKQDGQHRVLIQDFDFQLNLLGEYHVGVSPYKKRGIDLKKRKGGGFVLAYGEQDIPSRATINIARLDEGYNVLLSAKMPDQGDFLQSVEVLETEDNGYVLSYLIDRTDLLFEFWFPTAVFGLDSLFNIEWEQVFVHRAEKQHISTVLTEDGNILGIGSSDYITILDVYPGRVNEGWCFLLGPEGDLLWDRIIADIRESKRCVLWHGLETNDGFVMTGAIDKDNPTGVPFLNDPEVWFLTLDKNGCWNSNCEEVIVITGDSTSITGTHEVPSAAPSMKAYPNPTMGLLTIETGQVGATKKRSVRVSGMDGRPVTAFGLTAPKSTVNLRGLENGVYIVTLMEDGMPVSSKKIIVQH